MHKPQYLDIVLVGGGHAHAQVIKMWAMKPLAGVRLSLISPASYTPYSGMLPGLIAGHYRFQDAHIDLRRLCQFASVRYIDGAVERIDTETKELHVSGRPAIGADIISINCGITPANEIPGAREFAIGVKPIASFHEQWLQLLQTNDTNNQTKTPYSISVVGAGIAGVELSLAMAHYLRQRGHEYAINLIHPQADLLNGFPEKARQTTQQALDQYDIQCLGEHRVCRFDKSKIVTDQGKVIESQFNLLCTQAKPATWPALSGLVCDKDGFITLNKNLQSVSHPWIFAGGDTAQQVDHPRPQAGVFAVRQGPVLFENLRRFATDKPLKSFTPQKNFLKIMSLGGKNAVAIRGDHCLSGALIWKWKNHIDKKFMAMFQQLPTTNMVDGSVKTTLAHPAISGLDKKQAQQQLMRCDGCGAKVGATILSKVMSQLEIKNDASVILGVYDSDDAAAVSVPDGKALVQSVDSFSGMISDEYLQGRLAALHALSDIFAMGAAPHSAQVLAAIPSGGDNFTERSFKALMQGALTELNKHQCLLIGGHTSEADDISLGLTINAFCDPEKIISKSKPQADDHIILCKPIGTGILFAAQQQYLCEGPWLEAAIESMLISNSKAAKLAEKYRAHAVTDITGFGLLGHLCEMLKTSSDLYLELKSSDIPAFTGAKELALNGVRSSLFQQNQLSCHHLIDTNNVASNLPYELLHDPQTSGGLAISCPPDSSSELLNELKNSGYASAAIIGAVKSLNASDKRKKIKLT